MLVIPLVELLVYRMWRFHLLNLLMLLFKRGVGWCSRKYALVAFGQGLLAREAFR